MSAANRSTDWRRKQARKVRSDIGIERHDCLPQLCSRLSASVFSQMITRQAHDVAEPVIGETAGLNTDCHSDNDIFIDGDDQEMLSPTDSNSEQEKNDFEQIPQFEPIAIGESNSDVKIDCVQIAVALIALKSRHRLSNKCIDDILSLLGLLGIDVPSSYKALCTVLRKRSSTHLNPSKYTICPHCDNLSSALYECTTCGVKYAPILPSKIPLFYTYSISQQLKAILATSPDLSLVNNNCPRNEFMRDITDGSVYQALKKTQTGLLLTLTMNIDGVQPNKGSDQSLWPILLVINEIKRKKRFALENLIIAGMWPGPSKPSRTQIHLLFKNIMLELQELERGGLFQFYSSDHENRFELTKIFLIGACCDKPAQSIVQCLPEPTAFFGCGHCELMGVSVSTNNNGSVVSFAIYETDPPTNERTNERHDLLIKQLHRNAIELTASTYRGRRDLTDKHKQSEKGVKGPCVLRSLSNFDVGSSFLVDSLHNVYLGLFKRILSLWLSPEYKGECWSIWIRRNELSILLNRIRFPSTTTRHPRSLDKYTKYKGSEIRLVLLFGYAIFENILKPEYYSHLLLLVLIIHYVSLLV
ncbi:unnamed protein product [Adineta ricciae]|uniref:Transposase domain-containing protein n=1 Tax=Adineta ricciae TaxID=249248 RepID=A0A815IB84_ADIRI|nr:unnamed protein product [Adineta ricciae]